MPKALGSNSSMGGRGRREIICLFTLFYNFMVICLSMRWSSFLFLLSSPFSSPFLSSSFFSFSLAPFLPSSLLFFLLFLPFSLSYIVLTFQF
jgi:hypothetical protein